MKFSLKQTNIVKGAAILFMYVHHFYLSPDRYSEYSISFFPLSQSAATRIAVFLKICVGIFLFLSGYGMYISTKKKQPADLVLFSARRYIKLLLGFQFIFLLVQAACLWSGRFLEIYTASGNPLQNWLIDFLGLAELFRTPSFLGTWWYISLISMIIWIYPLLVLAFEKWGWPLLPVLLGLSFVSLFEDMLLFRWLPLFVTGMIFARYGLFEKCSGLLLRLPVWGQITAGIFGLLLFPVLIIFRAETSWLSISIRDCVCVGYTILYLFLFVSRIPLIRLVLEHLGIHSMTMFLTHTLIRQTYFRDFSYGFGNAWLNLLVFTIVTYLLAVCIDWLEEKSGILSWISRTARAV